MTSKEIGELLKYPERLAEVSEVELRALTAQYPHVSIFHQLLYLKHVEQATPIDDRITSKAAASISDRHLLFAQYRKLRHRSELKQAEVKTSVLAEISEPFERASVELEEQLDRSSQNQELNLQIESDTAMEAVDDEREPKGMSKKKSNNDPSYETSAFVSWLQGLATFDELAESPKEVKTEKKKKKKDKKKKKKKKKSSVLERTSRSIEMDGNIATETLAKVLTEQGQYAQAIEMYERLRLIIPEKSTYFADRISKLKKKI